MSDLKDFLHSRILRNLTTWIVTAIGGAYGGVEMYLNHSPSRWNSAMSSLNRTSTPPGA
jgi:hypothetical protein